MKAAKTQLKDAFFPEHSRHLDQFPSGMSHFSPTTLTSSILVSSSAPARSGPSERVVFTSFSRFILANSKKDSENTPVKGGNVPDLGVCP